MAVYFEKQGARENFEHLFLPLRGKPVKYLEIGVYDGDSLFWMLDNVVAGHTGAKIFAVDPYQQMRKHSADEMQAKHHSVHERLRGIDFGIQVSVIREMSRRYLIRLDRNYDEWFDVVYIDGDHMCDSVLQDLVLVWPRLKPGGILLCDDYGVRGRRTVKVHVAVDAFVRCYGHRLNRLEIPNNHQWACEKLS